MKRIELFTNNDLGVFNSKIGYFLDGENGHLYKAGMPKYAGSYSEIPEQVKLSEFISNSDLKNELKTKLESDILSINNDIVNYLSKIKEFQNQIISKSNILSDIENMKSFKQIFKHIIK